MSSMINGAVQKLSHEPPLSELDIPLTFDDLKDIALDDNAYDDTSILAAPECDYINGSFAPFTAIRETPSESTSQTRTSHESSAGNLPAVSPRQNKIKSASPPVQPPPKSPVNSAGSAAVIASSEPATMFNGSPTPSGCSPPGLTSLNGAHTPLVLDAYGNPLKRGRGRPRKDAPAWPTPPPKEKRPRGRPRKHPPKDPTSPKRPRGRPPLKMAVVGGTIPTTSPPAPTMVRVEPLHPVISSPSEEIPKVTPRPRMKPKIQDLIQSNVQYQLRISELVEDLERKDFLVSLGAEIPSLREPSIAAEHVDSDLGGSGLGHPEDDDEAEADHEESSLDEPQPATVNGIHSCNVSDIV